MIIMAFPLDLGFLEIIPSYSQILILRCIHKIAYSTCLVLAQNPEHTADSCVITSFRRQKNGLDVHETVDEEFHLLVLEIMLALLVQLN